MPQKKYFSLKEANSMVPQLLDLVPQLQKVYDQMNNSFPDIQNARDKAKLNGGSEEGAAYLRVALLANRILRSLESKGCVLKGIDHGLVDFLSLREGKEVYLCWKNPEKEIRYWHDLDTGFAGRQPI